MIERIDHRVMEIKNAKIAAYKHVCDLATELLERGSGDVFEQVRTAFAEYEKLEEQEQMYLKRKAPELFNIVGILANCKNIKDVYWKLPQAIKDLWDNIPELRSWKDEYR